jgi:ferric-dicitrate binding protein FerR (iron transport regulator)
METSNLHREGEEPGHAELLTRIAHAAASGVAARPPRSPDEGWELVVAKVPSLAQGEERSSHTVTATSRRSTSLNPRSARSPWTILAPKQFATVAAVCLIAIVGVLFQHQSRTTAGEPSRTYVTATGQKTTLSLRDGSRIVLAPQTTLRLAKGFGSATRTVELSGEAYFEVRSTEEIPFIVQTGTTTTRVLGTTFNVRAYRDDASVRVTVDEGKVQSRMRRHAPVTLTAGMTARMTDSNAVVTPANDSGAVARWISGTLEFSRVPLPEVLTTLERWYGVRFHVPDTTLRTATVSGALMPGWTPATLQTLEILLDATGSIDRAGDTTVVTLRRRRHPNRIVPPAKTDRSPILPSIPQEVGR